MAQVLILYVRVWFSLFFQVRYTSVVAVVVHFVGGIHLRASDCSSVGLPARTCAQSDLAGEMLSLSCKGLKQKKAPTPTPWHRFLSPGDEISTRWLFYSYTALFVVAYNVIVARS